MPGHDHQQEGEEIDAWYSGKTPDFGGDIQALMRPDGLPIWTSAVEPGSVHDLTAAREHVLGALYAAARGPSTPGRPRLRRRRPRRMDPDQTAPNGCPLDPDNRAYNVLLRSLRCLGERGFALLTTRWRVLQHVTACPQKISDVTKAALVLTHFEHRYLTR